MLLWKQDGESRMLLWKQDWIPWDVQGGCRCNSLGCLLGLLHNGHDLVNLGLHVVDVPYSITNILYINSGCHGQDHVSSALDFCKSQTIAEWLQCNIWNMIFFFSQYNIVRDYPLVLSAAIIFRKHQDIKLIGCAWLPTTPDEGLSCHCSSMISTLDCSYTDGKNWADGPQGAECHAQFDFVC